MNILPITNNDMSEQIFDQLRGKRFFAVSYDSVTDKYMQHVNKMMAHDIVFGCQAMINQQLKETTIEEKEYNE